MKKWGFVLALIFVVVVGLYLHLNSARNAAPMAEASSVTISTTTQDNPAGIPVASAATAASNSSPATPPELATRAGMAAPPSAIAENIPPASVLENISHAVRQYGAMFGGNPVGNNAEITAALNGSNPKQINFIKPEAGMRINENGELVDAWGTPYFFHQISGTDMEIHSAGPDKIMWTADDLVTH